MTNAEAAALFASLPPDEDARILQINGDTATAEPLYLDPPGTNLDQIDDRDDLADGDEKLATTFQKW